MRKVYGKSQVLTCQFCASHATTENPQGIPTCTNHKEQYLDAIRCSCGEYLDVKKGKYGAFFTCMSCGPISWAKGMELKDLNIQKKKKKEASPLQKNSVGQRGQYIDGEFIIDINEL